MDNCNSVTELATDLWKKFGSLAPPTVATIEHVVAQMVTHFNEIIKNPKFHIGPRLLPYGQDQTGTIIAFGDRTFVAAAPTPKPSKIVVTKMQGRDHVIIHVCAFDSKGVHSELATFDVVASTPDGHTFEASVPAGVIPTVILDGQSITKTLSYHLLLTSA